MKLPQLIFPCCAALALSACVSTHLPPEEGEHRDAVARLKQASVITQTTEQRAVLYLDAAREASDLLGSSASGEPARRIYNQAAADLTVLLCSPDHDGAWNRPRTFGSYRLRVAKATRDGVWDPAYFTKFTPAADVDLKTIKRRNTRDGIGGALVGIRKVEPREAFSPLVGVTAPVTAVLDFKGRDVTLTLVDPAEKTKARVAGADRVLAADFSAPLAYYPQHSETWEGLMGAIRVSQHMNITGLYQLEPYDSRRIPLIFVHGLISTPRMWRNVINEVETDPELRRRYQCMVFAYPTGNPPLYSALRFREELDKFQRLHPEAPGYVLVGHSMGGLVSRAQITTLERQHWDIIGKDKARRFFSSVKPGSLVERATLFRANPHVARSIFICTPHRGSEMAVGSIGELAIRLIALPGDLVSTVTSSVGSSLSIITGDPNRLPTSVDGLSPKNPMLAVLDTRPMTVPYHSIIGDRGKGDSPRSSDGVVEYWSSHQSGAKTEQIVPGPHGACEMPETIAELRRLLHLHLKQR